MNLQQKKLLVFFCISYFDTDVRRKKETHYGREGRYQSYYPNPIIGKLVSRLQDFFPLFHFILLKNHIKILKKKSRRGKQTEEKNA